MISNLSTEGMLAFFYIFSNFITITVCLILFIYTRNLKQTSIVYFRRVLFCLIVYYAGDILWALSFYNIIGASDIMVKIARIIYYSTAVALAVCWLLYVQVLVNSSIFKRKKRMIMYVIALIALITIIFLCIFLDPSEKTLSGYMTAFGLIIVPFSYVIVGGIQIIKKRIKTDSSKKSRYTLLAIWPFIILATSVLQVIFSEIPIFCFASTIVTVALCMHDQDSLIFTDALTGINNRKMLQSYVNSISNKNEYYILMVDVNRFKQINDTYGHLEGDKALKFVSRSLSIVVGEGNYFLARYGGDEFIIIANTESEKEIKNMIEKINELLTHSNEALGFSVTASIGFHKMENDETLVEALAKADKELYDEKDIAHSN